MASQAKNIPIITLQLNINNVSTLNSIIPHQLIQSIIHLILSLALSLSDPQPTLNLLKIQWLMTKYLHYLLFQIHLTHIPINTVLNDLFTFLLKLPIVFVLQFLHFIHHSRNSPFMSASKIIQLQFINIIWITLLHQLQQLFFFNLTPRLPLTALHRH